MARGERAVGVPRARRGRGPWSTSDRHEDGWPDLRGPDPHGPGGTLVERASIRLRLAGSQATGTCPPIPRSMTSPSVQGTKKEPQKTALVPAYQKQAGLARHSCKRDCGNVRAQGKPSRTNGHPERVGACRSRRDRATRCGSPLLVVCRWVDLSCLFAEPAVLPGFIDPPRPRQPSCGALRSPLILGGARLLKRSGDPGPTSTQTHQQGQRKREQPEQPEQPEKATTFRIIFPSRSSLLEEELGGWMSERMWDVSCGGAFHDHRQRTASLRSVRFARFASVLVLGARVTTSLP